VLEVTDGQQSTRVGDRNVGIVRKCIWLNSLHLVFELIINLFYAVTLVVIADDGGGAF